MRRKESGVSPLQATRKYSRHGMGRTFFPLEHGGHLKVDIASLHLVPRFRHTHYMIFYPDSERVEM